MENLVRYIQFRGHIDEGRIGRTIFDDLYPFLACQFLNSIIYLILNRLDQRLPFFVQFTILTEILTFEFQHVLFFLNDLLFAFRTHGLGEEDLLCLVVSSQHTCLLLRRIDFFLPTLGEHGQLLIRLLILRQILEDITHIDERYRLIFSKSRAKSHHGCQ